MLKQGERQFVGASSTRIYKSATVRQDTVFNLSDQPALHIQTGTQLDPGIRRKNRPNEDMLSVIQGSVPAINADTVSIPFTLMVVADGMGGMGNGLQASHMAVEVLVRSVLHALKMPLYKVEDLIMHLQKGVLQANRAVYKSNLQQETMMGTTMTAALVYGTNAYVANVGDSRLYHHSASSGLIQITSDHSLVAMLAKEGIITPEEIYTHPGRNQIYRSLGANENVEVDTFIVPLVVGDALLLGSDGLWEMVRDQQLAAILAEPVVMVQESADKLVQAALTGGGDDNVSAIVARVVK